MIDQILPVLKEASKAILDIYVDEDRFHIQFKSDESPLTEADLRSNKIICDALADLYPDIPVISEETKEAAFIERSGYDTYFLVDPLDGTKEFVKRNGEFTINIAYLEGHQVLGGFVYIPVKDHAYMAEQGEGALRMDNRMTRTALKSHPFHLMDQGLKVVASRSHRDPMTDKIISRLQEPEIMSVGSALKFLLLAEGQAQFYPRLAPTMEWDTAAAQCILTEAGGSIVQYENLLPLVYNKPNLLNPHFIAMGALLDPESLVDLLSHLKE